MFLTNLLLLVLGQMVAGSISTLQEPVYLSAQPEILYSAIIYTNGRPSKVLVDNLPSPKETRVQTGTPVSESDVYPFIGALGDVEKNTTDDGYAYNIYCTASLIDKQTVLTAGHCNLPVSSSKRRIYVHSMSDIRVQDTEDYEKKKDNWATITSLKTHPKYTTTSINNYQAIIYDISVGRLEKPLEADSVSPICLAQKQYTSNITGAGWGYKDCYTASQETLRRANGKIYTTKECNEILNKRAGAAVSKLNVCSTFTLDNGEAAAVAPGDSGGPLFSNADPNRPVQIGVASFVDTKNSDDENEMCTLKDVPQVYGRVSAMKKFINSIATEAKWC